MSYTEATHQEFITRSSYEGTFGNTVNVMTGFGSYRYPDGSEYRGGFHQGQFHGFGQIRLSQPYRFTFKGEFKNGCLVSIEDMWFADGLHVQGQITPNGLDWSKWDYLTPLDRRYQAERRYGQQPVGPTAYLTSKMVARTIPKKCYDTEEGIYNSETCWLTERPPPLQSSVYVGCKEEKDWIMNNCRKARSDHIVEPKAKVCRNIIENNLATERMQLKRTAVYAPFGKVNRERYYHNLAKPHGPEERDPLPTARQRKNSLDDPAWETDACLRAYGRMLDEMAMNPGTQEQRIKLPRHRSSSSNARIPKSGGDSSCESASINEDSIPLNVRETYLAAEVMKDRKVGDNFSVVQSNLIRRISYMDMTRSVFEL
ncbi:uncharacterized protein LOC110190673 [Drosophila serrata]|uniref:uncharacterized protein LOC110190673 n=1 Tax=Drosophila serrata TaxID=7274 RepID=UPI000A1D266A|nr:uncharacterized protein LOC110190673 [Drosophila serrata]KAH8375569.1 hypothetical protein KR200_006147 [Drosophila serrata]